MGMAFSIVSVCRVRVWYPIHQYGQQGSWIGCLLQGEGTLFHPPKGGGKEFYLDSMERSIAPYIHLVVLPTFERLCGRRGEASHDMLNSGTIGRAERRMHDMCTGVYDCPCW
jgi:hypothetical protein